MKISQAQAQAQANIFAKISIEKVNFSYANASYASLEDINLHIKEGEFILLTGKSGSGKSSLTSCVNGLIPSFYTGDFSGKVLIEGKNIANFASYELSQKIGSVFQDPRSQFFTTDTTSELAFSCENFGVPRAEIHQRILTVCQSLGIKKLLDRNLFQLSSGEKQKIAIASVLMLKPKVILFDEPSANLDYATCLDLAKILELLKKAGHTIIVAEHRIFYLKNLVDKMFYIENFRIAHQFSNSEFLQLKDTDLKKLGLRSLDLTKIKPKAPVAYSHKNPQELLRIENLDFGYKPKDMLFKNANFSAKAGDLVAILGANGSGKTTLAKLLVGLLKPNKGKILIKGVALRRKNLKNYSSFIMQDADYQLFTESLEQELKLGNEKIANLAEKISAALEKLNLSHLKNKHPAALSGGEKQRLTIAQALVKGSNIIILDEPTSGLDALNMRRLTSSCIDLASKGKAVFIITHDYEFILKFCNKILFIREDKTLEYWDFNQKTKDKVADIFNSMQQNWTSLDDRDRR